MAGSEKTWGSPHAYEYVKLGDPLSSEVVNQINAIGHWMNQNVIVRLYSILDYYRVIGNNVSIDQSIEGWKEIDLTRRLRNVFSHSTGKFNPENENHVLLANRIIEDYKLFSKTIEPKGFLIPIDELLVPVFDGCKKYVEGIYA